MTSHKSHTHGTTASTDIITYRYGGKLVYVPVEPTHLQAIQQAREAFPQLRKLHNATLSLFMGTPSGGSNGRDSIPVRVSASAWPKLIKHLTRYQIVDVCIDSRDSSVGSVSPIPDITVTYADANEDAEKMEPVPPYRRREGEEESDGVVDEKTAPGTRSRTLSNASSTLGHRTRCWFVQKLHGQ